MAITYWGWIGCGRWLLRVFSTRWWRMIQALLKSRTTKSSNSAGTQFLYKTSLMVPRATTGTDKEPSEVANGAREGCVPIPTKRNISSIKCGVTWLDRGIHEKNWVKHWRADRANGSSSELNDLLALFPDPTLDWLLEWVGVTCVGDGGGVLVMECVLFSQIPSSKPERVKRWFQKSLLTNACLEPTWKNRECARY